MTYNNVYFRTPRGWMIQLAKKLNVAHDPSIIRHMFDESKENIKKRIMNYMKASAFIPLEWIIPLRFIINIPKDCRLYIEPGSRMVNYKNGYICYLENGIGLFSFNTKKINKINVFLLRLKIKSRSFKGFVYYSHAAKKSKESLFDKVGLSDLNGYKDIAVIPPYTKDLPIKKTRECKRILFCSSSFNLKGGREVVTAFHKIKALYNVELILVTNVSSIDKSLNLDDVTLIEFNLSPQDYQDIVNNVDLVIHPTYFDTHALSMLEAIKSGIPAIVTNTFALTEYISDGMNGIVINNPYNPFDCNYQYIGFKGTMIDYAKYMNSRLPISDALVEDIVVAVNEMLTNYSIYKYHSECLPYKELTEKRILQQWNIVIGKFI